MKIDFSPESSNNQFTQIIIDEARNIEEQIKNLCKKAHEQVLTRNLEFFRSVVFDKTQLQQIVDQNDCQKIRFTHIVVTGKNGQKYSSLIAAGEDSSESLITDGKNSIIYTGTPAALSLTGPKIRISGSKIAPLKNPDPNSMNWTISFADQDLSTWLQMAFHDQKPVFLPISARFMKTPDWETALASITTYFAVVPAIFHCKVTPGPGVLSITGDYCAYVIIGLNSSMQPIDKQFFAFTDMWRPNYPISLSPANDNTGLIDDPNLDPRDLAVPNP